jgi:hypothetical protein
LPAAALVAEPELAEPELDDPLELDAPAEPAAPGTPGWAAWGGGEPIGGAAPAFCEPSQVENADGAITRTVARISECPAPHSSVHSAG